MHHDNATIGDPPTMPEARKRRRFRRSWMVWLAVAAALIACISVPLVRIIGTQRPVFELQSKLGPGSTPQESARYVINSGMEQPVALTPDGLQLLSPADGSVQRTLAFRTAELGPIAFAEDGTTFAAARCPTPERCAVGVWSTADGRELHSLGELSGPVYALFYSAAEYYVLAVDPRGATTWYLTQQSVITQRWDAPLTPDGRWQIYELPPRRADGIVETGGVTIDRAKIGYDAHTSMLYALGAGSDSRGTYSPRSMLAAWRMLSPGEGNALLMDQSPGQTILTFDGDVLGALDQQGRSLLIAQSDALIAFTLADDGRQPAELRNIVTLDTPGFHEARVPFSSDEKVVFSRDGERLAVISGELVKIWDLTTMKVLRTYQIQSGAVRAADFAAGGDLLLVTSDESWLMERSYKRFYRLR